MGILNTRQGEVCMVAPPLLDVHVHFFFSFQILIECQTMRSLKSVQTLFRLSSKKDQRTLFVQIIIFSIRNPLDHWPCNDFSRLAHPSSTMYRSSLDSHCIIQDVMIFRSWPIPHKLCIVNHQGWSSFLHQFKLKPRFFCDFFYQSVIGSQMLKLRR